MSEKRLFLLQADKAYVFYVEVRELPDGVHPECVRVPDGEPAAKHSDWFQPPDW